MAEKHDREGRPCEASSHLVDSVAIAESYDRLTSQRRGLPAVLGPKQVVQGPVETLLTSALAGTDRTTVGLELEVPKAAAREREPTSYRVPQELLETHKYRHEGDYKEPSSLAQ